jgi:hypothetical protein
VLQKVVLWLLGLNHQLVLNYGHPSIQSKSTIIKKSSAPDVSQEKPLIIANSSGVWRVTYS